MAAIILIALSVAAPIIAKDLRRQKELESQHRAEQYVRAIRLFYRKTHNYPANIDALKNTSNIRFLRQEYVDPLTGKSDWKLIHLGEQKTTVKGFFGQELGGIGSPGSLGSAAGLSSGIGAPIGSSGSTSTSTVGATSALASGFQGASTTFSTSGTAGNSGATGSTGAFGSTGSSGALGGGGVIIGVGSAKTGDSIIQPNQQTTYETWEFWYDPRIEQLYQKGQTNAGVSSGSLGSASSLGSGITGASGSTGSSSSFSNSFSNPSTSSPTTTTSPTTTPQP